MKELINVTIEIETDGKYCGENCYYLLDDGFMCVADFNGKNFELEIDEEKDKCYRLEACLKAKKEVRGE